MARLTRAARLLVPALLLALMLAPTRATAQEEIPPPAPIGPYYVVQSGDSLFTIAQAFGLSVEELVTANGITDPNALSIGQQLSIPGLEGVMGVLAFRTVAPGDTFLSLAAAVANPIDDLIRLNRIVNPGLLYVGQSLIYTTPLDGTAPGLSEGRVLVAQPADTPLTLAARYDLHPTTLETLNNLSHPSLLFSGQRLIAPVAGVPLSGLPAPMVSLQFVPERPAQGQPVAVRLTVEPGTTVTGQFGDSPLPFFTVSDTLTVALHGIFAFTTPGLYPFQITATSSSGQSSSYEQFVAVRDAGYEFQQIYVEGDTAGLLDDALVTAEATRVRETTTPITPTRYWEGAFQAPAPMDRLTAPFGIRRSYNGGPYNSFHGGLDIGGPSTTPVVAPANGIIVLAERLQVRGNAMIIDHGWGIYTGYWHLSQLLVESGQSVVTGQQIGFIGSTGLSTGNHLHWEVWANNHQVDPLVWMQNTYP